MFLAGLLRRGRSKDAPSLSPVEMLRVDGSRDGCSAGEFVIVLLAGLLLGRRLSGRFVDWMASFSQAF